MIEQFTLTHAELIVIALIILLIILQIILLLIDRFRRRQAAILAQRAIKQKEQRKRAKQEQHSKKSREAVSENLLDKFAGLIKPDGVPDEEVVDPSLHQADVLIESAMIEPEQTVPPEPVEETTEATPADTAIEQKKTFKHQDQLNKLRAEALRAKEKGQIDIYEKKLIEGLSLEPEYPEFLTLLADHYFHTNHYKRALTLLKRLLDHDKTNHRAMWQMGEIYLSHGDIKTAEIMIEQAVKHQQNNPRYLYSLVDIKYNSDKVDDAIYLMERILKLRPTNVEYLIATAMLYEKNEDFDRARRYYATIIEYDPDNHTAKHKLKEL